MLVDDGIKPNFFRREGMDKLFDLLRILVVEELQLSHEINFLVGLLYFLSS